MNNLIALSLTTLLVSASCKTFQKAVATTQAQNAQNTAPETIYPSPDTTIQYQSAWTKVHYPARIAEFRKNPLAFGDVVFLGNSITEQGGDWSQRFQANNVKNRGIAGDVTAGVLKRLGEIGYYKPKAVFLLIGINDLFNTKSTPGYVANNIFTIATTIHEASPHTKIYVQTILPTSTEALVDKIRQTNKLIESNAPTKPVTVLDIYTLFADSNGFMKQELTRDGVHLTEAGYQLWTAAIKKYVQQVSSENN
jgi:lysophospholipase L1-like esterase